MSALLARWELIPTVPATATALDRHPEVLREYASVDPAIHGFRHVPYAGMSRDEQARDLDAAVGVFAGLRLPSRGFRAPYLQADNDTLALLRERGFAYDSSFPWFALPKSHPAHDAALEFATARYGQVDVKPVVPRLQSGLVELPVALPDDEILVDAMDIEQPATLGRVLRTMFDTASRSGSLLVLQIHPERFHLFAEAVEGVLRQASDTNAWMAPLSTIAAEVSKAGGNWWPHERGPGLAITGDLDAVSLSDFGRGVSEEWQWRS
jgi:hypothetical protein